MTAIPVHAFRTTFKESKKGFMPEMSCRTTLNHGEPNTLTIYSTVTDLAKFRGKSTLSPSPTASQYAMSWRGMTLSKPWRQSTVLGISIFSVCSDGNSLSSGLQMTIGRPPRAMTGWECQWTIQAREQLCIELPCW